MNRKWEDGNLKIIGENTQFGVGKNGIWLTHFGKKYSFDFALMWFKEGDHKDA